jgi:hypothetical protein
MQNSKTNKILLIVLIILVLGLGFVLINKNSNKNETPAETLQEGEDEGTIVKETYTYTNHGFSIELPKGFVPKEEPNTRGTRTAIYMPDGVINYITDVDFYENNNLSSWAYIGDKKIGNYNFKVYTQMDSILYWFKQGKVGYNFGGNKETFKTDNFETFKFVGWPQVEGNKNDLGSFSIKPGQEVSGKMTATGILSGGYFFEANVGVRILDANKKVLKNGYGMATADWMTAGPIPFTTTIDFTGLPKGKAYVEIRADNPSGLPEYDMSIFIPIVIK